MPDAPNDNAVSPAKVEKESARSVATAQSPPRSSVSTFYANAHAASGSVLQQTIDSAQFGTLCTCHSVIDDLHCWRQVLVGRRELLILDLAATEYELSLLAVMRGDYRGAFIRLRLHIELICLSIYGSANRLDLEDWIGGIQDTSWNRLTEETSGVFSTRFCRSFCPELVPEAKHYRSIATALYRECSEYVHGNISVTPAIPVTLSYSDALVQLWTAKATNASLIVTFLLTMRYLSELSSEQVSKTSEIIMDRLGHIHFIQHFISNKAT